MKTRSYLEELAKFGWYVQRDGAKHVILGNRIINIDRPLTFRRKNQRDIDPIIVAVETKQAGLIWDQRQQRATLNPNHPYYNRYLEALAARKVA